jgi:DNA-binding MarR family transcriptional regulator
MSNRAPRPYTTAAAIRAELHTFLRRTDEACRAHALTSDQYTLLLLVAGAPGGPESATVTELAARLGLSTHGMAERVRRAEEQGLIARRASERDGRVAHLRLTADGERRLAAAYDDLGPESDRLVAFMESVDRGN